MAVVLSYLVSLRPERAQSAKSNNFKRNSCLHPDLLAKIITIVDQIRFTRVVHMINDNDESYSCGSDWVQASKCMHVTHEVV